MDEQPNINRQAMVDSPDYAPASIENGLALELRRLANDIAAFTSLHNSRLRRLQDAPHDAECGDGELDRRRAQLEARERELERRQRDALQHVEEECAQLTAAWDRLEAEQRRVLAHGGTSAAAAAAPQPAATVPSATAPAPAGDFDLIDDLNMAAAGPALNEPWSREPAAQQFQQMKREIHRHARRRKP